MNAKDTILNTLSELGIAYEMIEHAPAHTMDELRDAEKRLLTPIPKNLFLTPRNQSAFYLCVVRSNARFRTADISKQIGSSRLSFGPEDKLMETLRVSPGSISPLGLMFDAHRAIRLLVDESLLSCDRLAFHPNDNAFTLSLLAADFFEKFLPFTGHQVTTVHLEVSDENH